MKGTVELVNGHVFVCYSRRADRGYVEALATHLTAAGLQVWFDREIITGARWERMIRTQIDACAAFVVVMSPDSEASDWVTREIHRADAQGKSLFPLLLRGEVFFRLSNLQYEPVAEGVMPSASFVDHVLHACAHYEPTLSAPVADLQLRDALADIERIARSVAARRGAPSLVRDFALAEVGRIQRYLTLFSDSEDLVYEGEDRDWLLGLTRSVQNTIDSTSLVTVDADGRGAPDGGLWQSSLGLQYADAQRDAVARGVTIRRIFIIDRPELRSDADLAALMRDQEAAGVVARLLDPASGSYSGSLPDIAIFDRTLSYHIGISPRHHNRVPLVVSTTLVSSPGRVAVRVEQFNELWSYAEPI